MTREEAADLRAAALVASLNAMPLSQRRALLERPIPEHVPSKARMVVHPSGVCAEAGASFALFVPYTDASRGGCAKDISWDGTCVVVGGPHNGFRYRPAKTTDP